MSRAPPAQAAAAAALPRSYFFNELPPGGLLKPSEGPLPDNHSKLTLGVDGDFLIEQLLIKCHEAGDKYWMFSDAFPAALPTRLESTLDYLTKQFARVVVVFDGVPMKTVDRTASNAPKAQQSHATWRTALDPRQPLAKQQADASGDLKGCLSACHEGAFPDGHALGYLKRLISQRPKVEVFTAPSLAWAQLALFATPRGPDTPKNPAKPEIDVLFAPPDVLVYEGVTETIVNVATDGKCLSIKISPEVMEEGGISQGNFSMLLGKPQPRHARRLGNKDAKITIVDQLKDAPAFDVASMEVKPFTRHLGKPTHGTTAKYFNDNLLGSYPVTYYVQAFSGIDPTVLSVLASSQFQDQQPILPTIDYDVMIQRIMPLRAQIIYQLIQAVAPYYNPPNQWTLQWERPNGPGVTPPTSSVPICQPPEITLDEWDLSCETRVPPVPPMSGIVYGSAIPPKHTLSSVVANFSEMAVPMDTAPRYDSTNKVLAATLLKSLDLLGYFTHSAGATTMEQSTGSVYAAALSHLTQFPEEGVLFVELCRTRTLTEAPPSSRDVSGMPSDTNPAVFLALRILSLLNLQSKPTDGGHPGSVNPFLFAYVSQVRCFQTNLRHLCEVVLHNLLVAQPARIQFADASGANGFNPAKVRDVALQLPFGRPLSCTASNVAITIMHYGMLDPAKKPPVLSIVQHVEAQYGIDFRQTVRAMELFWKGACDALDMLATETDIRFEHLTPAKTMVAKVFDELKRGMADTKTPAAGGR